MDLGRQFDVVICIGVIQHTQDPDATFRSIYKHCKPGGKVVVWAYSFEGNELVRWVVEPIRALLLRHLSRKTLVVFSHLFTLMMLPFVYTIYRFNWARHLPYFEYFKNFRKLSYHRNMLNVFDKLNAPSTVVFTRQHCETWFSELLFEKESIHVRWHAGVSYSLSGIKKSDITSGP